MKEKYVKGYFALSRFLVSDFSLFSVLFWSSVRKFKALGSQILESWVLRLGSWVLGPGSWVPGPRSRILGPGTRVLGSGSWVLGPYVRLCHMSTDFYICISFTLKIKINHGIFLTKRVFRQRSVCVLNVFLLLRPLKKGFHEQDF